MKSFKESAMRVRQGDVKPTAKIMVTQHIEKGNFKKTLDLLKHIGKKVKVDKSTEKTSKAIWTIEGTMNESAMDQKMFDSLKKGDKLSVSFGSGIRKDNKVTLLVKSKSKSAKYNLEKINCVNVNNPGGMKYTIYNRQGKFSLAQGDMATSAPDFVKESVEEASIIKTVHKNVTNKKSAEKDRKKAVKTVKDIRKGKYAGVKMANEDDDPCWDTHKKVGTKMKGGKRVNDCVPKNEGKKPVSQMTPAEKAADAKRRKEYIAFQKSKRNESTELEEKGKGLWHNIRKKRERGEPKAKPGDKDYPKTLNIESTELDEAIGKLGPNASREDKIKHTMKIMKMYPANKGKSEKELRKGATDYIDQFTNKNKKMDDYVAKHGRPPHLNRRRRNESVDEAKTGLPTGQSTVDYENSIQKLMKTLKKDPKNKGKSGNELRKLATFKLTGHKLKESVEKKTFWDFR